MRNGMEGRKELLFRGGEDEVELGESSARGGVLIPASWASCNGERSSIKSSALKSWFN